MNSVISNNFRFADFELDIAKRLLFRDGETVALNSKTFDLLERLIASRGEVLSREQLIESIWPDQFVEESNLTVQISTLRKSLGETLGENKFIVTVPGKGYKFVGEPDDGADEITIENHHFERIIVADEIIENEPLALAPKPQSHKFTYGLISALVVLLLLGGGFYAVRRSLNASAAGFNQIQIRQLTFSGKVQTATLSPDGKQFAFVADDLGKQSLWLGRVDGGSEILLRPAADASYGTLAFSPESDKIFFSIYDDANPEWAIYQIPTFGGVAEKIRDGIGIFILAPDGRQFAYIRPDRSKNTGDLMIADVDGGTERVVATLPQAGFVSYSALSFSPDGQSIAFGSAHSENDLAQDVSVVRITTGEVRSISANSFGDINRSAWLADGSGIVITAFDRESRSAVPQYRVWFLPLSGGEARKITSDLSCYNDALSLVKDALLTVEHRQMNNVWVAPVDNIGAARQITAGSFGKYDGNWGLDWLPDGRIVFDSSDAASQSISVMNADGGDRRQLTPPGNVDSALSASPDGKYVVFHSTRGGNGGTDIWRVNADGSSLRQLTFTKQSYQPFVSADSRFVYYKSWADGIGEMCRIGIDGGEPVRLTNKETSQIAASPDGRYIAASYRTDKRRLAIFAVDGGEPIKQFEIPKTGTLLGGSHWTPDSSAVIYGDTAYGYWQQSISGGEAIRMDNLPKEKLYNCSYSRDGRQFAYVRGVELRDVVLITNSK